MGSTKASINLPRHSDQPSRLAASPAITLALLLTLLSATLLLPQPLQAKDVFLTIGGGYSPTGNQISLEKNVQLFSSYLAEAYDAPADHYVFFSDGHGDTRDLQYVAEDFPRANELVAAVFNQSSNLKYRYRDHQLNNITGGSNKQAILNWFQKQGSGLQQGDRLIIYVTAHGGKPNRGDDQQNTRLHLWNGQSVDVAEFRGWLDLIDPEVPIMVVMVQCYSGGFANLIFEPQADMATAEANDAQDTEQVAGDETETETETEAETEAETEPGSDTDAEDTQATDQPVTTPDAPVAPLLVNGNRCGFFATVHNRVAAGCTADTKEENYFEYTTYLMEALRGETRLGQPVTQPDYDENGMISMDEAHTYALINSKTIDISIKTSDRFLKSLTNNGDSAHYSANTPIDELLQVATLNQKRVVEELSATLGLERPERADAAKALADRLQDEKKKKDREFRSQMGKIRQTTTPIKNSLVHRWPELLNPWNPSAQQLLDQDANQIIAVIEQHPNYGNFITQQSQLKGLREEAMDLDRKWVKCQRLIHTLESIAAAANLAENGTLEDQEAYLRLCQLEAMTLGSLGQAVGVAQPNVSLSANQP